MTGRSSTRVHAAPGGRSSFSLGWGGAPAPAQKPAPDAKRAASAAFVKPPSNPCMARAVRQFTNACDQPCPDTPQLMTRPEVEFITKMVLDELLELNATVMSPAEAKQTMSKMVQQATDVP